MKHHFPLHAAFLYQTLVKTDEQLKNTATSKTGGFKNLSRFFKYFINFTNSICFNKTKQSRYFIVFQKDSISILRVIRGGSRTAATSKMERFVIIVNDWKPLTIITKRSILDVAAVLDPPLVITRKTSKNLLIFGT